jgi:hypothetical protein
MGIRVKNAIIFQTLGLFTQVAHDMVLVVHDFPVFAFFIPIAVTSRVKELNPKRKSEGTMRLSVILYR